MYKRSLHFRPDWYHPSVGVFAANTQLNNRYVLTAGKGSSLKCASICKTAGKGSSLSCVPFASTSGPLADQPHALLSEAARLYSLAPRLVPSKTVNRKIQHLSSVASSEGAKAFIPPSTSHALSFGSVCLHPRDGAADLHTTTPPCLPAKPSMPGLPYAGQAIPGNS